MKTYTDIAAALERSISHTETAGLDYGGTIDELLTELFCAHGVDADGAEINGTYDVWGTTEDDEEVRLSVSL